MKITTGAQTGQMLLYLRVALGLQPLAKFPEMGAMRSQFEGSLDDWLHPRPDNGADIPPAPVTHTHAQTSMRRLFEKTIVEG